MTKATRRVAAVSGGSSGIGLATVRALLEDGFNVAFFGQNEANVEEARKGLSLRADPGHIMARCVDLAYPGQLSSFFHELAGKWGEPDTLICSAGISPKGPTGPEAFTEMPLDMWEEVLRINLTGAMLCCQSVLPGMIQQSFGRIVLIGSVAGRTIPRIAGPAYVVSKAALSGLSHAILAATAGSGVTINIVAPGRIVTAMTGARESAVNQEALSRIPVGRLGEVSDIASTVRFLTSREAGFINGAVIDANGGEFSPI